MTSFDTVWHRIVTLQGETFYQKRGQPFRYGISGNSVVPSTTNRQLPRSHLPVPISGHRSMAQGNSRIYRDRPTCMPS